MSDYIVKSILLIIVLYLLYSLLDIAGPLIEVWIDENALFFIILLVCYTERKFNDKDTSE